LLASIGVQQLCRQSVSRDEKVSIQNNGSLFHDRVFLNAITKEQQVDTNFSIRVGYASVKNIHFTLVI
jgi:hypothetical protein